MGLLVASQPPVEPIVVRLHGTPANNENLLINIPSSGIGFL
jgi:hypothetical protein